MDPCSKKIRAMLRSMAPPEAISYVRRCALPPEEEYCLIACDIRGCSVQYVAADLHMSPESVWRRRKRALKKMSNVMS